MSTRCCHFSTEWQHPQNANWWEWLSDSPLSSWTSGFTTQWTSVWIRPEWERKRIMRRHQTVDWGRTARLPGGTIDSSESHWYCDKQWKKWTAILETYRPVHCVNTKTCAHADDLSYRFKVHVHSVWRHLTLQYNGQNCCARLFRCLSFFFFVLSFSSQPYKGNESFEIAKTHSQLPGAEPSWNSTLEVIDLEFWIHRRCTERPCLVSLLTVPPAIRWLNWMSTRYPKMILEAIAYEVLLAPFLKHPFHKGFLWWLCR